MLCLTVSLPAFLINSHWDCCGHHQSGDPKTTSMSHANTRETTREILPWPRARGCDDHEQDPITTTMTTSKTQ